MTYVSNWSNLICVYNVVKNSYVSSHVIDDIRNFNAFSSGVTKHHMYNYFNTNNIVDCNQEVKSL
jgi:hypothetical protein